MSKYIVVKREVWTQMVEVEAESDLEAIQEVSNGKGTEIDDTLEYSHTMPVDSWTVDKKEQDRTKRCINKERQVVNYSNIWIYKPRALTYGVACCAGSFIFGMWFMWLCINSQNHLPTVRLEEHQMKTYHVTGVDCTGKRFKIITDNPIHAAGINVWRGTKWEVDKNGRRHVIQRIFNQRVIVLLGS